MPLSQVANYFALQHVAVSTRRLVDAAFPEMERDVMRDSDSLLSYMADETQTALLAAHRAGPRPIPR